MIRDSGKLRLLQQITATLSESEGEMVRPPQQIFKGSASRCHPSNGPPQGWLFSHILSHWQDELTFIVSINESIVL